MRFGLGVCLTAASGLGSQEMEGRIVGPNLQALGQVLLSLGEVAMLQSILRGVAMVTHPGIPAGDTASHTEEDQSAQQEKGVLADSANQVGETP